MKRYVRLYLHFLRFSFSKAFQFRLDFFFRIGMDIFYYAVNILFFKVIFLHTKQVGTWDENQITVFICGYLLVDALYMTIFSNNLWWFPIYINRGDLDYYLVRPVSSLFFLTLREFAANSFVNLLMAIGLFIWSIYGLEQSYTLFQLLLYVLLIINGAYLYSLFYLIFLLPVFWTKSPRGLAELYWKSAHLAERPDHIYKGYFRRFLLTVFPMILLASFPARLFLDGFDLKIFLWIIFVTVTSSVGFLWLWNKAMKNYTSASS